MSDDALQTFLSRLPSHFRKDTDSNNYKLFKLISEQVKDRRELLATIKKFHDVDQAEGVGLDRLGKDVGLSRDSYDDEIYRKLIKIQYFVNISQGEIESINKILSVYIGEDFKGLEEGWISVFEEPAALVVKVSPYTKSFATEVLKRIKAAGVSIKYFVENEDLLVIISTKSYDFPVQYPITNTFDTAPINGIGSKSESSILIQDYSFIVPYPVCGTFFTGGEV